MSLSAFTMEKKTLPISSDPYLERIDLEIDENLKKSEWGKLQMQIIPFSTWLVLVRKMFLPLSFPKSFHLKQT